MIMCCFWKSKSRNLGEKKTPFWDDERRKGKKTPRWGDASEKRRAKQHSNSHLFDGNWFTKEQEKGTDDEWWLGTTTNNNNNNHERRSAHWVYDDISGTKELRLVLYYLTWVHSGQFIYKYGRRRSIIRCRFSPHDAWHLRLHVYCGIVCSYC
jgi:hypothetical protein